MKKESRPLRAAAMAILWSMLAFLGAFIWLFQDTPLLNRSVLSSRVVMDPQRMAPDQGFAWIYPSRWFGQGDDVDRPRSGILLFENGAELMGSRARHDIIRAHGVGAWSHWTSSIFFSSTDGSDPRTNGRRYEIQGLTLPVRLGGAALACVGGFLALLSFYRLARAHPSARMSTAPLATDAPSKPPPSRRRRFMLALTAMTLSLGMVAVMLVALELILRWRAGPSTNAELALAENLGWVRATGDLRVIPADADPSHAKQRILFMGDSFAHLKTWSDKTITLLRDRGLDVVGYEAGVSGYGTTQELMLLRRLIPAVKPDVVVLLFYAWNDLRDNWGSPGICYNPRMTLRPYMDDRGTITEPSPLLIRLRTLEIWKQVLEPVLDPMRVSAATALIESDGVDAIASTQQLVVVGYDAESTWRPFYQPHMQDGAYVSGAWSVTATGLAAIRDLCAEHGCSLVIIGLDNPFTVDRDVLERWLPPTDTSGKANDADLPLRRLDALLAELGIRGINATPALRARRDLMNGDKQFDGDPQNISSHLLPDAEAVLAELLDSVLDGAPTEESERP